MSLLLKVSLSVSFAKPVLGGNTMPVFHLTGQYESSKHQIGGPCCSTFNPAVEVVTEPKKKHLLYVKGWHTRCPCCLTCFNSSIFETLFLFLSFYFLSFLRGVRIFSLQHCQSNMTCNIAKICVCCFRTAYSWIWWSLPDDHNRIQDSLYIYC